MKHIDYSNVFFRQMQPSQLAVFASGVILLLLGCTISGFMFGNALAEGGQTVKAKPLNAEVQMLLQKADNYRKTDRNVRVNIAITSKRKGRDDKTKAYVVYSHGRDKSLVDFKHKKERGQKMLMLSDNFYLLSPRSRRAVRITPIQKLLGEASSGDISTFNWAGDYNGEVQERGEDEILLALKATRKGLTYDKISLRLNATDGSPKSALLYLTSGKLSKTVFYEIGNTDYQGESRRMVVLTRMHDAIKKDRQTHIRYLSQRPSRLSRQYFNPNYLVNVKTIKE